MTHSLVAMGAVYNRGAQRTIALGVRYAEEEGDTDLKQDLLSLDNRIEVSYEKVRLLLLERREFDDVLSYLHRPVLDGDGYRGFIRTTHAILDRLLYTPCVLLATLPTQKGIA